MNLLHIDKDMEKDFSLQSDPLWTLSIGLRFWDGSKFSKWEMAHSGPQGRSSESWAASPLTGRIKGALNLTVFICENQNNASSLTEV